MRKLTLAALSSVLFLSGCGALIGSIVGPQPVDDPLQLDGTDVEITTTQRLDSTAIDALASIGSGSDGVEFADVSEEETDLPFGLNIVRFTNGFSIADTVTVTKPDDGFPNAFTISDMSLSVTLSDVGRSETVDSDFAGNITFTRNAECDIDNAETCEYTVSSSSISLDRALFTIAIQSAARAQNIVDILTTGGQNTVEATVSFTTESTPELAGGAVTIKLKSLEAEVRVG